MLQIDELDQDVALHLNHCLLARLLARDLRWRH